MFGLSTRRLWLWLTVSYCFYPGIRLIISTLLGLTTLDEQMAGLGIVVYVLGSAIVPFLVIYRCAYRGRGNRVLTYFMIVSPLTMLMKLPGAFALGSRLVVIAGLVFDVFIWLSWIVVSVQLRRDNRQFQRERALVLPMRYTGPVGSRQPSADLSKSSPLLQDIFPVLLLAVAIVAVAILGVEVLRFYF